MKTKFTKGEWENSIDHSREAGIYPKTIISSNGKLIAECYKRKWTIEQEEAEANAKLIAAAPEMFELLETIENDKNQVPEWLWNRIKIVIKKATE